MHNNKRKNFIIMSVLVCTLIIMSTGYAILTQVIKVDGTVTVERDWDVKITGITDGTPVGAAENEVAPSYDATTASFSTLLYNKGDSMTYSVTVENFGSWDAKLETITLTDSNNPAVKFTVSGVNEGDALPSGSTHVLTVKVEYNSAFTGELTNNVGTLTVSLTYVQDDGNSGTVVPDNSSKTVYAYHTDTKTIGTSTLAESEYATDYTQINGYNESTRPWFLKYELDSENVIQNAWACMKYSFMNEPVCMQGYKDSDNNTYYDTNKTLLTNLQSTFTSNGGSCSFGDSYSYCNVGNLIVRTYSNGYVRANDTVSNDSCNITDSNSVSCQ